jgi:hypothetical protein
MDIFSHEGPMQMMYGSCLGCKWHSNELVLSGRNPIYDHFCSHSVAIADDATYGIKNKRGRRIGTDDTSPMWCPVIRKNSVSVESSATDNQQTLPAAPGVPGLAQGHIGNVG